MKFKCHLCNQTLYRDMRKKENKASMTKRGYRTMCQDINLVYLKPLKN